MSHVFQPVATAAAIPTRALDPYVEGLRAWRLAVPREEDGRPLPPLVISDRLIHVEPEDWIEIDRHLDGLESAPDSPGRLIAYGVALMVKCATDLDLSSVEPGQAPGAELTRQAELGLDASLGDDLCRAIQEQVDALVNRGELERTRVLSAFLHRLRHALDPVRASFHPAAEPVSGEKLQPTRHASPESATPPAAQPRFESEFVADLVEPVPADLTGPVSGSDRFRTLGLAGLLALALFVQQYVVHPPRTAFDQVDPTNAVATAVPGVRTVDVRWPSAFVTIDRSVWQELRNDERADWARQAFERLRSLGYEGALISLEDETPVAHWHSAGEIRRVDFAESSPLAKPTPVPVPGS